MVQLPPAPSAAKATASAASALATASLTTTVGGYTYDWTALKAAIVADTEVASGYCIVGNAFDPTYLLEFDKGSFGIDRVTPLASASKWFAGPPVVLVTVDDVCEGENVYIMDELGVCRIIKIKRYSLD